MSMNRWLRVVCFALVAGAYLSLGAWPSANPAVLAQEKTAQDKIDLTGMWYQLGYSWSVRQVGTEVWWVGRSDDGGKTWTHAGHGQIKGKQLIGTWADVPLGEYKNSGTATLDLTIKDGKVVRMAGNLPQNGGGGYDIVLTRTKPEK